MNIDTPKTQTTPTHDAIAAMARELWEKGGRQPNRDLEYWLDAEQRVLARQKPDAIKASGASAKLLAPAARLGAIPALPARPATGQPKQSQRTTASPPSQPRHAPAL